jgi:hypothetical protein
MCLVLGETCGCHIDRNHPVGNQCDDCSPQKEINARTGRWLKLKFTVFAAYSRPWLGCSLPRFGRGGGAP